MEPPAGPCSSPPGPRPVPPPRKGSMERRPLSPVKREGEHLGAWDAASEVSARGSKPGIPERATVTQRVLIVMQSHASPLPAAVTSPDSPLPEKSPIPSWGASPPPEKTPIPSWGASPPPEKTPIPSWGASPPPEKTPIPSWGASPPPEKTPIPSWGASPPPEKTPIPSWGASPPPEKTPIPSWGASPPPEKTPIPSWGASPPPEKTPTPSWGASPPPEKTPTPSWGASPPPEKTPTPSWGASPPPEKTPTPSWGASPPPEKTPTPSWGASPPPEKTPTPSWGASPPPEKTPTPSWGASPPPEKTPTPSWGASPPPEKTPTPSWGASPPPEKTPTPSWGASPPPEKTPTPSWGASPPPEKTPTPSWGASPPPEKTPTPSWGASPPPEKTPTPSWGASPPPEKTPIQSFGLPQPKISQGNQEMPPSEITLITRAAVTLPECTPPLTIPVQEPGPPPTSTVQEPGPPPTSTVQEPGPPPTSTVQEPGPPPTSTVQEPGPPPTSTVQEPGPPPTSTVQEPVHHSATQDQQVSPPEGMKSIGRSPHSSGAPPHCTGAQDRSTTQDTGAQEDITRNVCKSEVTLNDGVSQSRNSPQNVTEDVRPRVIRAGPEDGKSTISARPEDAQSTSAVRPEDGKSAAAARPEDAQSTSAVRPEDGKSAARPEDGKSASAARPQDGKSAAAARPEDMQSAPAAQHIATISPKLITQQEVQQMQDGGPVGGNMTETPTSQSQTSNLPAQPNLGWSSLSPIRVPDPSSPHRNMSSKPPLPIPPRSNLYPGHPPREQESSASHETASLSSFRSKAPAPDTLSYLDSVSLMSGTMESLTLLDDASSIGSDSEINGMPYRKTDKYGFLGGNQFSGNGETPIPVEIARQRELKWLDMFGNWDKWLIRRFQKVKLRCRKGIPSSLRAKAWQFLSNSHELLMKNPGKFEEMERQQGDPKWLDVIEKDLHRQFPFHEMFAARGGHGQQDLYRILKAYTVYRPEEGYCQAQAPVAAVLLMHMPAEQAFWCLVQICDKYLPGYYSAGLEAIQLDGEIFFALLRRICPMAYRHLKKFKIDPILYMTEWFMCIFSRTLPWASVLRVWDMFFCEGVKIVFRVGLVLLKHTLGSVDKLRSCQGMYETMEKLRSLPVHCMQEEILLPEVSSLPVTDALIDRESNTQLRKWRENRGELQYRPSRRLHGARQIYEEKLRLNPSLSGSRLSLSSIRRPSPPATPMLAVQPESLVVSEGLRPALPSPTSNKAPLGPPREANKKGKEKQREQEKKKEREEREREKKREKEEREERRKEKEREKLKEKEEKRVQKEREKAEPKQKKERKFSFRRKESSAVDSSQNSGPGATESSPAHDTYF